MKYKCPRQGQRFRFIIKRKTGTQAPASWPVSLLFRRSRVTESHRNNKAGTNHPGGSEPVRLI